MKSPGIDLAHLIGHARLCVLFCADIPTDLPTGWTLKERGEGRQMIVGRDQLKAVEPVAFAIADASRSSADAGTG